MTRISVSEARRGEAGLTLFELLVVLSILALALAAVGNLARRPDDTRAIATSAQAVINLLEVARSRASGSGKVTQVVIDPDRLRLSGSGSVARLEPGITLTARVAREASATGGAAILFFPDGTSTGGTLELASETVARRVVVDWLTGGIHAAQ
jgi:general secretion pathway protein H